jgi:F-type H+-transporting ATPase subunit b
MVPKIQSTVDQRDQRIADDLAAAEKAKADADATEEAYRAKMDESRAEAMKLTGAAKQEGALATEKRLAKADKSIQDKAAKAEARLRESRQAALANLEGVAAELTQDIADKVAGISVGKADAAKAVKEALYNG